MKLSEYTRQMTDTKGKKWGVGAGVVVLIIIVVWAFAHTKTSQPEVVNTDDIIRNETVTGADDASKDAGVAGQQSAPAKQLTYSEALRQYADRRIQFGEKCNATPFTATYKSGTEIMIDNRSERERAFNIDGAFTVKGYGFKIIKLSSATLPKTILVDCGGQQNVATILLQK